MIPVARCCRCSYRVASHQSATESGPPDSATAVGVPALRPAALQALANSESQTGVALPAAAVADTPGVLRADAANRSDKWRQGVGSAAVATAAVPFFQHRQVVRAAASTNPCRMSVVINASAMGCLHWAEFTARVVLRAGLRGHSHTHTSPSSSKKLPPIPKFYFFFTQNQTWCGAWKQTLCERLACCKARFVAIIISLVCS